MKKLKSIWIRLLIVVISVAMMIGCLGGIVFADEQSNGVYLHESGKMQTKVALDGTFTVLAKKGGDDVTLTVKDPTGNVITSTENNTYRASVLGNYTVNYAHKNGASYTYNINCYEEEEYYIFVDNNGAAIPTIIQVGGKFVLPEWHLAKDDADGNMVFVEKDVETSWTLNGTARTEDAGDEVTVETLGSQIIALSANFEGSRKTYSEEITVIAQTSFEDTSAPIIRNIANMPSSASRRTKVSLPIATAEDDYDDNVSVTVEVTDPSGLPVNQVVTNDQDYAVEELKDTPVKFDNDKVMSFYPMADGAYTVIYTAKDDSGNESSQHKYTITVSDRTGPVITETRDDKVPSTWGLTSVQNGNEENNTLEDLTLYIPIPDVVDNVDEFTLNEAGEGFKGDITMIVEVANPNVTVARSESITPAMVKDGYEIDAKKPAGSTYNKYFKDDEGEGDAAKDYGVKVFVKDEVPVLKLNFGDFCTETEGDKVKAAVTGNWTVTFSFRDKANNGGYNKSQKVYTINVSDEAYIDEDAPEVEAPALPDYFIVGGSNETYTVPAIVVKDDKDTNLTEDYYIYTGNGETNKKLYVDGGETLQIVNKDSKYYFVKSEDALNASEYTVSEVDNGLYFVGTGDRDERYEALEVSEKISFAYTAIDDAGNEAQLKDGESDYSLNIYTAQDVLSTNVESNITMTLKNSAKAGTDQTQYLGSFTVKDIKQREFIGFELAIFDKDGNSLDGVSSYVYFSETSSGSDTVKTLNVKNIQFNPAKAGEYQLVVRVFDANENTYVYVQKVNVTADDDYVTVGSTNAATSWENEGSTRESYMLQRKPFTVKNEEQTNYTRVFRIYGGRFSLLGYEFTPIAQGGYTITEYYTKNENLTKENGDFEKELTKNASYGMKATDENTTRFEIDGKIPSYHKLLQSPENNNTYQYDRYYITPSIIAYSDTENYDVTVTYTDRNGNQYTAKKAYRYVGIPDAEGKVETKEETANDYYTFKETDGYEFFGQYALVLDKDGTYTVTVRANDTSTQTYTIKVGDIKAPQFTLSSVARDSSKRVGDSFSYRTIANLDADEADSEIKVYYKLYEPGSSSEVSSVSGSMTYSEYKKKIEGQQQFMPDNAEYKFEKSGDYTVEITVEDEAGNRSVQKYTISVSTTTSKTPTSLTMLSTVLIIVGVLLIIGVVIYLIRFRKRKA